MPRSLYSSSWRDDAKASSCMRTRSAPESRHIRAKSGSSCSTIAIRCGIRVVQTRPDFPLTFLLDGHSSLAVLNHDLTESNRLQRPSELIRLLVRDPGVEDEADAIPALTTE